jgi:hypothetical protein
MTLAGRLKQAAPEGVIPVVINDLVVNVPWAEVCAVVEAAKDYWDGGDSDPLGVSLRELASRMDEEGL